MFGTPPIQMRFCLLILWILAIYGLTFKSNDTQKRVFPQQQTAQKVKSHEENTTVGMLRPNHNTRNVGPQYDKKSWLKPNYTSQYKHHVGKNQSAPILVHSRLKKHNRVIWEGKTYNNLGIVGQTTHKNLENIGKENNKQAWTLSNTYHWTTPGTSPAQSQQFTNTKELWINPINIPGYPSQLDTLKKMHYLQDGKVKRQAVNIKAGDNLDKFIAARVKVEKKAMLLTKVGEKKVVSPLRTNVLFGQFDTLQLRLASLSEAKTFEGEDKIKMRSRYIPQGEVLFTMLRKTLLQDTANLCNSRGLIIPSIDEIGKYGRLRWPTSCESYALQDELLKGHAGTRCMSRMFQGNLTSCFKAMDEKARNFGKLFYKTEQQMIEHINSIPERVLHLSYNNSMVFYSGALYSCSVCLGKLTDPDPRDHLVDNVKKSYNDLLQQTLSKLVGFNQLQFSMLIHILDRIVSRQYRFNDHEPRPTSSEKMIRYIKQNFPSFMPSVKPDLTYNASKHFMTTFDTVVKMSTDDDLLATMRNTAFESLNKEKITEIYYAIRRFNSILTNRLRHISWLIADRAYLAKPPLQVLFRKTESAYNFIGLIQSQFGTILGEQLLTILKILQECKVELFKNIVGTLSLDLDVKWFEQVNSLDKPQNLNGSTQMDLVKPQKHTFFTETPPRVHHYYEPTRNRYTAQRTTNLDRRQKESSVDAALADQPVIEENESIEVNDVNSHDEQAETTVNPASLVTNDPSPQINDRLGEIQDTTILEQTTTSSPTPVSPTLGAPQTQKEEAPESQQEVTTSINTDTTQLDKTQQFGTDQHEEIEVNEIIKRSLKRSKRTFLSDLFGLATQGDVENIRDNEFRIIQREDNLEMAFKNVQSNTQVLQDRMQSFNNRIQEIQNSDIKVLSDLSNIVSGQLKADAAINDLTISLTTSIAMSRIYFQLLLELNLLSESVSKFQKLIESILYRKVDLALFDTVSMSAELGGLLLDSLLSIQPTVYFSGEDYILQYDLPILRNPIFQYVIVSLNCPLSRSGRNTELLLPRTVYLDSTFQQVRIQDPNQNCLRSAHNIYVCEPQYIKKSSLNPCIKTIILNQLQNTQRDYAACIDNLGFTNKVLTQQFLVFPSRGYASYISPSNASGSIVCPDSQVDITLPRGLSKIRLKRNLCTMTVNNSTLAIPANPDRTELHFTDNEIDLEELVQSLDQYLIEEKRMNFSVSQMEEMLDGVYGTVSIESKTLSDLSQDLHEAQKEMTPFNFNPIEITLKDFKKGRGAYVVGVWIAITIVILLLCACFVRCTYIGRCIFIPIKYTFIILWEIISRIVKLVCCRKNTGGKTLQETITLLTGEAKENMKPNVLRARLSNPAYWSKNRQGEVFFKYTHSTTLKLDPFRETLIDAFGADVVHNIPHPTFPITNVISAPGSNFHHPNNRSWVDQNMDNFQAQGHVNLSTFQAPGEQTTPF